MAKNLMLLIYRIPDRKLPTERELKLEVRGSITEFVAEYDGCELLNVSSKDNCPYVATTYIKHMGGVVLHDSLIGRYKIIMLSKKWYFRLF